MKSPRPTVYFLFLCRETSGSWPIGFREAWIKEAAARRESADAEFLLYLLKTIGVLPMQVLEKLLAPFYHGDQPATRAVILSVGHTMAFQVFDTAA